MRRGGNEERWIVSVKGVLVVDGHVALAQNDRHEWELPGGRVDHDDPSLTEALRRECLEELGIAIEVGNLIEAYVFEPIPGAPRLIITYVCTTGSQVAGATTEPLSARAHLRRSEEHLEVAWVPISELSELILPDGYRRSIAAALAMP